MTTADDHQLTWREEAEQEFAPEAGNVFTRVEWLIEQNGFSADVMEGVRRFIYRNPRPAMEFRSFEADPIALDCLVRLAAGSRHGLGLAIFVPHLFWHLVQEREFRQVWGRQTMAEDLHMRLQRLPEYGDAIEALLRFQQYHLVRIMLGDLTDTMGFEAITSEISDLADVCIQGAVNLAEAKITERGGPMPGSFTVFGFGKLGARELNYSSDIDLVFTYKTAPPSVERLGKYDDHEWFVRLGREVIRILDTAHAAGRLYRVDMRLRPEGASGELALSFDEVQDYCYTVGRAWERQAWIKARPCAGDIDRGDRLVRNLQSWIFPSEPSPSLLEESRLMRLRMEERGQKDNVKVGAGGIRDIEFLVQYFQLGYGGRMRELRSRATLPSLDCLYDRGFINREHHAQLRQDYEWLRMVEHRLQMWESRQFHTIPEDETERRRFARRCDFTGEDNLERFEQELSAVRTRVRELAGHYYLEQDAERSRLFALIGGQDTDDQFADDFLRLYDFKNVPRAVKHLRSLSRDDFFVLNRGRTETALLDLLPFLLLDLSQTPDPDAALANFVHMSQAVGGRALFFEQLLHDKPLRRQMVQLAGWANFLIDIIRSHQGLMDEVVERLSRPDPSIDELYDEARLLCDGVHDFGPVLRFVQAREFVVTALRDLKGADLASILNSLTRTAVSIVRCVNDLACEDLAQRFGIPQRAPLPTPAGASDESDSGHYAATVVDDVAQSALLEKDETPTNPEVSRFAVLALGKAGSGEMSYASDLDVIFVYENIGETRNEKDAEWFWERVAQKISQTCKDAWLYEIDARLRPYGDQGSFVTSLKQLREYWSKRRDLWERLAMTRVYPIAGDKDLGREAASIICSGAYGQSLDEHAVVEVCTMRRQLEESVAGRDHVKRGWGGYVDVEFLGQYLGLAAPKDADGTNLYIAGDSPDKAEEVGQTSGMTRRIIASKIQGMNAASLPIGLSIASMLHRLRLLGHLSEVAEEELRQALTILRHIESRARLYHGSAISSIPNDKTGRHRFARCAGYGSVRAMDLDLHHARSRARHWFTTLVGTP